MDIFFSVALDMERTLLLTEISRRTYEEQCSEVFDNDSGLFIVLEDRRTGTLDVLAKAGDVRSGNRLIEMMTRANSLLTVTERA
ncbi:MAG: hypothetical protein AAGA15_03490 [Pseudomonadota bacterium]